MKTFFLTQMFDTRYEKPYKTEEEALAQAAKMTAETGRNIAVVELCGYTTVKVPEPIPVDVTYNSLAPKPELAAKTPAALTDSNPMGG